jgi:hypothetical protein
MITRKHFAALIGFAFVAAWVGFNFGYAVLCLVGAALFYYAASFLQGELDLGELQARLGGSGRRYGRETPAARTPRVQ